VNVDPNNVPQGPLGGMTEVPPAGSRDGSLSRRKIFKIAATAAPVLIAMSNRPAWASNCVAASAWISANPGGRPAAYMSHAPGASQTNCGSGCNPSYWQQFYKNEQAWTQTTQHCAYLPSDSKTFSSIMGSGSSLTFGALLHQSPSSSDCAFAAAYLSAMNSNQGNYPRISQYPLTGPQIVQMYKGTFKTGGHTWTTAECLAYFATINDNSTGQMTFNLPF